MTNLLLAAILLAIIGWTLFCSYKVNQIVRRWEGEVDHIKETLTQFFSPVADGQPSPFANVTDAIASQIARAITVSVKTTLMGMASGESREALAMHADQARQAGLGSVLDVVPSLKKKKYQGLVDLAMMWLANKGNGHQTDPGATTTYAPKFKL